VAIEYDNNTPIAIPNLVISTHHAPSLSLRDLRYQLLEYVMKPVIPDRLLSHQVIDRERDRLDNTIMFVNPPGRLPGRRAQSRCRADGPEDYRRYVRRHGTPRWWGIFRQESESGRSLGGLYLT